MVLFGNLYLQKVHEMVVFDIATTSKKVSFAKEAEKQLISLEK